MATRPSLASALRSLDWHAALRAPRTWGIVARHMIPVAGVVALGWSGTQAISVVVLDTVAELWCLVAVASVLVARDTWWAKGRDLVNAVLGGALVFAIVAGLLTFAVGVVVFVVGGGIAQRADLDPAELLDGGWVFWAFGALLLMQLPQFLELLSRITDATAKSLLEPRVGYMLRRLILAALACSSLAFLWGTFALVGALIVIQLVLAAHEVFGERLHAVLFPERRPALDPEPVGATRRGRKRRRQE
jgi:hypothetical protein